MQKELETFASKTYKGPCAGDDVDAHFNKTLTFVANSRDPHSTTESDGDITAIHHTRNRLLATPYRLIVILDTLQKLGDLSRILGSQQKSKDNGFTKLATSAAYYEKRLEPLFKGIEFIKEKVKDMLNMIELGLSFKMTSKMLDLNNRMVDLNNRMLGANKQLLQLGNKNFDDNATVKIVTLGTLIYLPASLVSSVLGMNLFKFDDGTTKVLTISKQFWIFVVATIILAIVTLGGWYIWTHKEEVMRRKFRLHKHDEPQGAEQDVELDEI
ncbi:hypothetical protein N7448_000993 [Penicillium atrosanguineum]|nr:hypothetical protein N7448_000993 [Penicillium atrosanguineum]